MYPLTRPIKFLVPISTMDTKQKTKKIQAMNSYKTQFLYHLFFHSLVALTCSFLCSYTYWFPYIKKFMFLSLPNTLSSFFSPKCLFIVLNVIVVYLVGESRLVGSQSPPAGEIYEEYVERSRSLRGVSTLQDKAELAKLELNMIDESVTSIQDKELPEVVKEVIGSSKKEVIKDKEEVDEENVEVEEDGEEKERDGEEENGLPTEELNRRVEEFIARINKQRWLEEKLLVCCKA